MSNLLVLLARKAVLVSYASNLYILPPFLTQYPNRQAPGPKLRPQIVFQMSTPGIRIIRDIYSVPLMLRSGSIFPHAIDTVVHNGTFYAAGHDVIITRQGEDSL